MRKENNKSDDARKTLMGVKTTYYLLFLFITLSMFIACQNCPRYKPCPSIDLKYNVWLQNQMRRNTPVTIFIKDGDTTKIKFERAHYGYGLLSSMITDCEREGPYCACNPCREPFGSYYYNKLDTTFYGFGYHISWVSSSSDLVLFSYTVFNHSNRFYIGPEFRLINNDSLYSSFTFKGKSYTNVIVHQIDTMLYSTANEPYLIWKSYYSQETGVFAFFDLKSHSVYYAQ